MVDATPAQRRGKLKNGNPPGDLSNAPQCGAKTRNGSFCRSPAMPNGRCRMHGGPSTGPRTAKGLARSRRANWKHGRYSAASRVRQAKSRLEAEYDRAEAEYEAFIDELPDEEGSLMDFEEYGDEWDDSE